MHQDGYEESLDDCNLEDQDGDKFIQRRLLQLKHSFQHEAEYEPMLTSKLLKLEGVLSIKRPTAQMFDRILKGPALASQVGVHVHLCVTL